MKYVVKRMPPDELAHFGIKGQKWGVRRFQNDDGTWTVAGKERYGKDEGYKTNVKKQMKQLHKGIKKETGTDMGDFLGQSHMNDITVKKGSIAKRLSNMAKENNSGSAYVTLDDIDHMHYTSVVATFGSRAGLYEVKGTDPEGYSIKLEVTQDMVMPSYQHRMESFVRTVGKIGVDEVVNSIDKTVGKQWGSQKQGKEFIESFKNLKVPEARDKAYRLFIESTMKNPEHREQWFNDLKSHGYNAVVDNFDVDARAKNRSYNTSTIVFDRDKTLKQVSSKKVDSNKMAFVKDLVARNGLNAVSDQKVVDSMYDTYKKTKDWQQTMNFAVKAYKKEHPNTKMSDSEIKNSLFKGGA